MIEEAERLALGGMPLLSDKVCVVTGIGPGMGRSIATTFARHGARLVLGARRRERVETVAEEVRSLGADALVVSCDIAVPDDCRRLTAEALDRFGRIDVLVQNGHHEGDWQRVLNADADDWRRIFDVNVFGAFHLIQDVAPVMLAGSGGSIILINAGGALRTPPTMGAYAASKSALAALTRTSALELAPKVRVNGIFLGPVEGENLTRSATEAAAADGQSVDDWLRAKAREVPLGHIPTADECAGSVLFLASGLSAAVTGQHLSVNGGQWTS